MSKCISMATTTLAQMFCFVLCMYLFGVLYLNTIQFRDVHSTETKLDLTSDNELPHYNCKARTNFAFIKCMKCATETLGTVFRRFAYVNNLSVVLPVQKRMYLGWPFPMTPQDYRPSSREYNILIEHAIYNGPVMRQLMAPETMFVTMIRSPFDHFVSVLNYFNVFNLANVTIREGMEAVREYLHNIEFYERVYKSPEAAAKRYCIPDGFSITRNLLSHCLGMPIGFPPDVDNITDDLKAVKRYIKSLDTEFMLVMLMEYFDESLVLFKRLMCWSMKDIIYHKVNAGTYRQNLTKSTILTLADLNIHKHWSRLDYLLYDHFNKTFWRKVAQQDSSFFAEVWHFKQIQEYVSSFCSKTASYQNSRIEFPASRWSPFFTVSSEDCTLMKSELLTLLTRRYDMEETRFVNFTDSDTPRKYQPLC